VVQTPVKELQLSLQHIGGSIFGISIVGISTLGGGSILICGGG
jgi:hypothetical protein